MRKSFRSVLAAIAVTALSSPILHASAITVTAAVSNPPAGQVIMGNVQVPFAAYTFRETAGEENVKIIAINVVMQDSVSNPEIYNSTFYEGNTAVATATSATALSGGGGYLWRFFFASPVVIAKKKSITLTLRADVGTSSSGAVDNAQIALSIATTADSGNMTPDQAVQAFGTATNSPTDITIMAANGNAQTVLRSILSVTATAIGPETNCIKTTAQDIGNVTFTNEGTSALALNSVVLTITGTLPTAAFATNYSNVNGVVSATATDVEFYDPVTGSVAQGTATSTACSSGGTCRVTFTLGAGKDGFLINGESSKTFVVRVNSELHTTPGQAGISLTLGITIVNSTDVTYTTSVDGTGSTVPIAPDAAPIAINDISYQQGT